MVMVVVMAGHLQAVTTMYLTHLCVPGAVLLCEEFSELHLEISRCKSEMYSVLFIFLFDLIPPLVDQSGINWRSITIYTYIHTYLCMYVYMYTYICKYINCNCITIQL